MPRSSNIINIPIVLASSDLKEQISKKVLSLLKDMNYFCLSIRELPNEQIAVALYHVNDNGNWPSVVRVESSLGEAITDALLEAHRLKELGIND